MNSNEKFFIRHYFARVREVVDFFPNSVVMISGLRKLQDYMMDLDFDEVERVLEANNLTVMLSDDGIYDSNATFPLSPDAKLSFEAVYKRCVPSVKADLIYFENKYLQK